MDIYGNLYAELKFQGSSGNSLALVKVSGFTPLSESQTLEIFSDMQQMINENRYLLKQIPKLKKEIERLESQVEFEIL